jgi:hypothetical protein
MDFFLWSTVILSIWGAVGPLVGIIIGHRITKAWQREQWIVENKKQEYRELLSTLSKSFSVYARYYTGGAAHGPEAQERLERAEAEVLETINDRIFIAAEIREHDILKRWVAAVQDFERDRNSHQFAQRFGEICKTILDSAQAEILRK